MTEEEKIFEILMNLSNLESLFLEYSEDKKNGYDFGRYYDFLNSQILKERDLYRFYFHTMVPPEIKNATPTDMEYVSDSITPPYNFSICKVFNFPVKLRHKCAYFTMLYQMKGTCCITLDSGTHTLESGDIFIIAPEVYYVLDSKQGAITVCMDTRKSYLVTEYRQIFMESPQLCRFVTESLGTGPSDGFISVHNRNPKIWDRSNRIICSIFYEYIHDYPYGAQIMEHYLAILFAGIFRSEEVQIESTTKISKKEEYYHKIDLYIKANYQTATLTSTAEALHFSKQYICKIVKEQSGQTFNDLLMQTRLEIVKQYLEDSALSLEEIADTCGFAAAPHMSRTFKEKYGVSPSRYRTSATKNGG